MSDVTDCFTKEQRLEKALDYIQEEIGKKKSRLKGASSNGITRGGEIYLKDVEHLIQLVREVWEV